MKKHLFSFSFLLLSVAVMAQSKISYGVRAGITTASVQGDAAESFQNILNYANGAVTAQNKTGFYGGGFVSIPLSETFSIEPGITYAQKGYELKGSIGIKGTDLIGGRSQLNLGYVELPVLAKVNISGLEVFAGPQVAYLANATLRTTAGVLGFNFINDRRNVKDQFNDLDVSLTGGVGYQFGNGFRVQAAYDHGLSRMNAGQSIEAYNRVLKVGIGYRF
jgi:hypothetical protein